MKLRLLCSQVLKELLGQGIDVSTRSSTPLSHDLMTTTALKLCTRPGETGEPASQPLWAPPFLLSSLSVPYRRIQAGGEGLVSKGLAPPEGLLSPQYEKILKLTADAKFGEYPAESISPRQPWELGLVPGTEWPPTPPSSILNLPSLVEEHEGKKDRQSHLPVLCQLLVEQ